MYRFIFRVFLVLLMLIANPCTGAPVRFWPTGIQLGFDVLRPGYYAWYQQTGAQWELNGAVDFARVMLEGDFGWGSTGWEGYNKLQQLNSSYNSRGRYFRVGLNYNLIQDTPDKNIWFLGVRYAMSFFRDALDSKIIYNDRGLMKDEEQRSIQGNHPNVRVRWFEALSGFKVKIWEWVYMGCTVRYKFLLHISNAPHYTPFDVLGWGLHSEEAFGINYYLSIRIPLARNTPRSADKGLTPSPTLQRSPIQRQRR